MSDTQMKVNPRMIMMTQGGLEIRNTQIEEEEKTGGRDKRNI